MDVMMCVCVCAQVCVAVRLDGWAQNATLVSAHSQSTEAS